MPSVEREPKEPPRWYVRAATRYDEPHEASECPMLEDKGWLCAECRAQALDEQYDRMMDERYLGC